MPSISDECRMGLHQLCGSKVCACSHHGRTESATVRRRRVHRMSNGQGGQFAFVGYVLCAPHIIMADKLEAAHPSETLLREWYLAIARCERCMIGGEPALIAAVYVQGALKMDLLTEDELVALDADITQARWKLIQARREKGTEEEDMV